MDALAHVLQPAHEETMREFWRWVRNPNPGPVAPELGRAVAIEIVRLESVVEALTSANHQLKNRITKMDEAGVGQ